MDDRVLQDDRKSRNAVRVKRPLPAAGGIQARRMAGPPLRQRRRIIASESRVVRLTVAGRLRPAAGGLPQNLLQKT